MELEISRMNRDAKSRPLAILDVDTRRRENFAAHSPGNVVQSKGCQ